jgi:hypothetical protein
MSTIPLRPARYPEIVSRDVAGNTIRLSFFDDAGRRSAGGYAVNSLKTTTALWPPKPSALEIAARMCPDTPWFGT